MRKQLFRSLRGARAAELKESGIDTWHRGDLAAAGHHLRAAIAASLGFAPAYGNLGRVL